LNVATCYKGAVLLTSMVTSLSIQVASHSFVKLNRHFGNKQTHWMNPNKEYHDLIQAAFELQWIAFWNACLLIATVLTKLS